MLDALFKSQTQKQENLALGKVVPEPGRCVQCGICSYNCPAGIDVRLHASRDIPVIDSHCLTCGECVMRCPRAALRFDLSAPSLENQRGDH